VTPPRRAVAWQGSYIARASDKALTVADAVFGHLLKPVARLRPAPPFFANLGDFAGPGTRERHKHYLQLSEELPVPDICIVGNHDLDDADSDEVWAQIHGPTNFQFAYGNTRFIAIDAAPGEVGRTVIDTHGGTEGPDADALEFLAHSLKTATQPHRVVLMHTPPHFDGRYAPHPEWGFDIREEAFLALVRRHNVKLVCCAHALLFDHHVHLGTNFVVSGGGGSGLCSHIRGICTSGEGRPEDRGALFHAVQITVTEDGTISGRVLQAFEPLDGHARLSFGDHPIDT
jgi:hypothetical protein